jgi:hypothetical protein
MKLPLPLFQQGIQAGKIYYFSSAEISPIPHFFICIARSENEVVFLVCCTSQFEKRRKFIEMRNLPYSTLVWVKPNEDNSLEKDTFVDCNSAPLEYSIENLSHRYDSGNLEFKGEVTASVLEQIKIGLLDSPLIEENLKEALKFLIP